MQTGGAEYTEIDINGKSVFVPKHMKEGDRRKVKKIIEGWIDGTADDTDKLFGYAITLDEKQDVALKIYESTKSENAKKYLNRIEELTDTRISIVSVGPKRSQTIRVKEI